MVIPPEQAIVVRVFFTSEGRPAIYKPNCDFSLYPTADARLLASEAFSKCDW